MKNFNRQMTGVSAEPASLSYGVYFPFANRVLGAGCVLRTMLDTRETNY